MKNSNQPKFLVESYAPELTCSPKELIQSRKGKYLMVNIIARRARDLNRGDRALVDLSSPHTITELAMAEIDQNKLCVVRKQKSKILVNLIKND